MRDAQGYQICRWCHKATAEGDDYCSADCYEDECAEWEEDDLP